MKKYKNKNKNRNYNKNYHTNTSTNKEYPPYELLCEEYQEKRIGAVDFVTQQSDEMTAEYEQFCKDKRLDRQKETSALAFMDYREKLFEESLEN